MVTITVKDEKTGREMTMNVSNDADRTISVEVDFNPPLKIEKSDSGLWDIIICRIMDAIQ